MTTTMTRDERTVVVEEFEKKGIKIGIDIVIRDDRVLDYLRRRDEIAINRSYVEGLWDEGLVSVKQFTLARIKARLYEAPSLMSAGAQSVEAAIEMARGHYDEDEHIRLMLGTDAFGRPIDIYSCGYYGRSATNIAEAQRDKCCLVGDKMFPVLPEGEKDGGKSKCRVLEIGCGYGALAAYLLETYGDRIEEYVLITNSESQAKIAKERCGRFRQARVLVRDWRKASGIYDTIVSIGQFEHVGHENYGAFFQLMAQLLRPDGQLLLHTIYSRFRPGANRWLEADIFRGSELPTLTQISDATKGSFVAMDVHKFSHRDYERTLDAWSENLRKLVGENRLLHCYLGVCSGLFAARLINVVQYDMRRYKQVR